MDSCLDIYVDMLYNISELRAAFGVLNCLETCRTTMLTKQITANQRKAMGVSLTTILYLDSPCGVSVSVSLPTPIKSFGRDKRLEVEVD